MNRSSVGIPFLKIFVALLKPEFFGGSSGASPSQSGRGSGMMGPLALRLLKLATDSKLLQLDEPDEDLLETAACSASPW